MLSFSSSFCVAQQPQGPSLGQVLQSAVEEQHWVILQILKLHFLLCPFISDISGEPPPNLSGSCSNSLWITLDWPSEGWSLTQLSAAKPSTAPCTGCGAVLTLVVFIKHVFSPSLKLILIQLTTPDIIYSELFLLAPLWKWLSFKMSIIFDFQSNLVTRGTCKPGAQTEEAVFVVSIRYLPKILIKCAWKLHEE